MQKLYGPRQPEVGSIASVFRDEVQQVQHNRHYQPMPTNVEPAPVSTDIRSCTFAEALRVPVSSLPVASPAVLIQMMPPKSLVKISETVTRSPRATYYFCCFKVCAQPEALCVFVTDGHRYS
ncbi:hypothetical protein HPB52_004522 [Rhipicephalus sanguineus]|uniref:Uncharacterized protein n=1 Tax=Rhipicephalus sanguineus TaxID=34632 RepID=A0A9D4PQ42_RHISA|nr:hypothetical protein HPB52_004522 [Rhipicephalus sanguineus]